MQCYNKNDFQNIFIAACWMSSLCLDPFNRWIKQTFLIYGTGGLERLKINLLKVV